MSVHYGFTVEIYGLGIVYIPVWHVLLTMLSMEIEVEDSEDRRQRLNESKYIDDG